MESNGITISKPGRKWRKWRKMDGNGAVTVGLVQLEAPAKMTHAVSMLDAR